MKSFSETTTTTFKPEWIRKEFMLYDVFRESRKNMRKKMDKCTKCKHRFQDDEMLALASFGRKGNKLLCQSCADDLDSP